MRYFLYAKITRVNFDQDTQPRRDPKSVDFATQVLKKVKAWKFLVDLIQLFLADEEPFLS